MWVPSSSPWRRGPIPAGPPPWIRLRGNDDLGAPAVHRPGMWVRPSSSPWRREPIPRPPAMDSRLRGNDDMGGRGFPPTIVGAPCAPPSFPWRREPIPAGPPPWIPAFAGMTPAVPVDTRGSPPRRMWVCPPPPGSSSFPWRREPIPRPPAVDSRRRGNDDMGGRGFPPPIVRPSFPWRREPIPGPPAMDSRRRGNDDMGWPWIPAAVARGCAARRPPSFPWRREPIPAGPRRGFPPPPIAGMTIWVPWIPAVVGMTIVVRHRRPPSSRGDGNPSPGPPPCATMARRMTIPNGTMGAPGFPPRLAAQERFRGWVHQGIRRRPVPPEAAIPRACGSRNGTRLMKIRLMRGGHPSPACPTIYPAQERFRGRVHQEIAALRLIEEANPSWRDLYSEIT